MYDVEQNEFKIPSVSQETFLISSFYSKTTNDVPSGIPKMGTEGTSSEHASLAWNGISRILITPMTAGGKYKTNSTTETEIFGKTITFNSFVVTMMNPVLEEKKGDVPGTIKGEKEAFVAMQNLSYAVSVLTGDELKTELETTFTGPANTMSVSDLYNAVISVKEGKTSLAPPEASFLEQKTDDFFAQYEGTYATTDSKCRVEPIREACYIGAESCTPVDVQFSGTESNRTATFTVNRTNESYAFGTNASAVAAGKIPILAMIKIDLPEDLVGTVYTYDSATPGNTTLGVVNMSLGISTKIGITIG